MRIFNGSGEVSGAFFRSALAVFIVFGATFCTNPIDPDVVDDVEIPASYGILEVDFVLPDFNDIQKGIRRADLAVGHTLPEISNGEFLYRINVSDAKQIYQIHLPEGSYYYRAVITCTCLADSCIRGGFPSGYGGMKYAFDEVKIERGKKTLSTPAFQ